MSTRLARARRIVDKVAGKVFPDHWSFLLGELAMYSMLVLFGTGVVLALFFDASGERTVYDGSYGALNGVEVSRAYDSVLDLSFDVPLGLLLRQTHHWAAVVFVAAIAVHAARIFFTGAYRRPRRLNYAIGLTMLVLSMANGFFGVSLPDDLLSGLGVRVGYSIFLSIPLFGAGIVELLFAGELPSPEMINRFWLLHVFVLPLAILGLFSVHMALVWRQTHSNLPAPGDREGTVVGDRFWPVYVLKTLALASIVVGVLVGLGGLVQINPVWVHGPFEAAAATVPAGPDWYIMFVEGALRILPDVGFTAAGFEVPSAFVAGVVVPGSIIGVAYAWPLLDARFTGDRMVHHVLERPRDRPGRTGLGAAGLSLLIALTLAANHDYLGGVLGVDVGQITAWFRALVIVGPPVVGVLAWRIAADLARESR